MGVGLNWAVGEMGIHLRISNQTTVGKMGVSKVGIQSCYLCCVMKGKHEYCHWFGCMFVHSNVLF